MCDNCDWEEFVTSCTDALDDAETLPEPAAEFRDSVIDKIEGMRTWAEDNHHVTEKMLTALDRMNSGIQQWLRH